VAASRIRDWIRSDELVRLRAWSQGPGRADFEELKRVNTAAYPQFVEELRGIAAGAGLDVDTVWTLNLITELEALAGFKPGFGHCSDVFAADGAGGFSFGHNEDWGGPVMAYAYFVKYTAAAYADFESCAGFVYPGTILGWAPTWNAHGMFLTENSLYPVSNRPHGVSSVFAQRAAICGPAAGLGHSEVVGELTRHGWSSGASVNIVDTSTGYMINVEVAEDQHSVYLISNGSSAANYSHFNAFKHLGHGKLDPPHPSSMHRQARMDELPAIRTRRDVVERLSDDTDPEYPILRNDTLTTVVFDSRTARLDVWCGGQAAARSPPSHTWDMRRFFGAASAAAGAEVLVV